MQPREGSSKLPPDSSVTKHGIGAKVRDLLLHEWDPIGISGCPGAQHEYDGYVQEMVTLIVTRAPQQEFFARLWSFETEHMGLRGNRENTEAPARRLFRGLPELPHVLLLWI